MINSLVSVSDMFLYNNLYLFSPCIMFEPWIHFYFDKIDPKWIQYNSQKKRGEKKKLKQTKKSGKNSQLLILIQQK